MRLSLSIGLSLRGVQVQAKLFCLNDYEASRVYEVHEQVGYLTERDRHTYRAHAVHLGPSAMFMDT